MSRSSICICCAVACALPSARASAGAAEGEASRGLPGEGTLPPGEAETREAGGPGGGGEGGPDGAAQVSGPAGPAEGRARRPAREPDRTRRRFAVRVGAVPVLDMPGAAGVKDVRGGPLVGFTYGTGARAAGVSYELGLDVTAAEVEHATGGGSSSTVLAGRLGLVWAPWGRGPRGPYLTAGVWGFVESADILDKYLDDPGPYLNSAASCAVGAGLVFGKGRYDLRVERTMEALSSSPTDMTVVTAGVRF